MLRFFSQPPILCLLIRFASEGGMYLQEGRCTQCGRKPDDTAIHEQYNRLPLSKHFADGERRPYFCSDKCKTAFIDLPAFDFLYVPEDSPPVRYELLSNNYKAKIDDHYKGRAEDFRSALSQFEYEQNADARRSLSKSLDTEIHLDLNAERILIALGFEDDPPIHLKDQVDYFVKYMSTVTNDEQFFSAHAESAIVSLIADVLRQIPEQSFMSDTQRGSAASGSLSLIDAASNPMDLIQSAYLLFNKANSTSVLRRNLCAAAKEELGSTALDRDLWSRLKLSPNEILNVVFDRSYLGVFLGTRVMTYIPDDLRLEHTYVLGPSGSGKTTLLQKMILEDLKKPDRPAIVVIDPKGLMVERLSRLDIFRFENGRPAADTPILIIDPTAPDPPALNMFRIPEGKGYSEQTRRQIEEQVLSTFSYIFASMDHELTAKQALPFTFAVRLMFRIKDSDIFKLLDLFDDRATSYEESAFKHEIDRLEGLPQRFFKNEFYSKNFNETRQQVKARLYSILQRPEFVAMFSASENKLDMFDALQTKKLVLVNTAMNVLGAEGSQIFGRYMIAQTLNAAFERITVDRSQWKPAHLYIDEFQLFADEQMTPQMLRLAREYNLGITMAMQDFHGRPFNDALRVSISTNTSIKYSSSPEGVDLRYVAQDLRTTPDFLQQQTKSGNNVRFACYARGQTQTAVSTTARIGALEAEPKMTDAHFSMRQLVNAKLLAVPSPAPQRDPPIPVIVAVEEQPEDQPPEPPPSSRMRRRLW